MKSSDKWMAFTVLGALAVVGLCLLCIVGAVLVPTRWWSHGQAITATRDYLSGHAVVKAQLGAVLGFGRVPSRSESTANGVGKARIVIEVNGDKGTGVAEVELAKDPGKPWRVTSAVLSAGGQKFLLDGTPPDGPTGPDPGAGEAGPPNQDSGPLEI